MANGWQLIGLLCLGCISAWLRWSSPEQVKARKDANIKKLKAQLKALEEKRDELLAKRPPHTAVDSLAFASIIGDIIMLRKEIRDLERQ